MTDNMMRKLFTTIYLCAICAVKVFSMTTGEAGFTFLKVPLSAKVASLGESSVAIPGMHNLYNPAGLNYCLSRGLMTNYLVYYQETKAAAITVVLNKLLNRFTPAAEIVYFSAEDIARNIFGEKIGDINHRYSNISLACGYEVNRKTSFGMTIKNISQSILYTEESSSRRSTICIDAGLIDRVGKDFYGVYLQNLGPGSKVDSTEEYPPLTGHFGGLHIMEPVRISWQVSQAIDSSRTRVALGIEYPAFKMLLLRVGAQYQRNFILSCGFGIEYMYFSFDYSLSWHTELSFTHRIGLGYLWK